VHDLAVIHHPEWFDRRFAQWYGFLLPRLARRVAQVIAVSEHSKQDLEQTYVLAPGHVRVLPAYAMVLTTGQGSSATMRLPYILVVASRDPRKGLDRIVAWYATLTSPHFQLVIVGRTIASFRPLDLRSLDGVYFRSDVDDSELHSLYTHAIALVHLSRYEGFGLPVLEALNAGCPVIAMELPVLRENFGTSVQYLPENDLRPLHALVSGLLEPTTRERYVQRGRQCAAEFTFERMAQALHDILDPLLDR
jgi:glycosyltransferase involved in cell wall biosynthesis